MQDPELPELKRQSRPYEKNAVLISVCPYIYYCLFYQNNSSAGEKRQNLIMFSQISSAMEFFILVPIKIKWLLNKSWYGWSIWMLGVSVTRLYALEYLWSYSTRRWFIEITLSIRKSVRSKFVAISFNSQWMDWFRIC